MKRILAFVLVLVMLFSLAACGGGETPAETPKTEAETPAADKEETQQEEPAGTIEVDEKLFNVEISLPAQFFDGESEADIIANAEEQGIKKCVVNDDGSVTYTMSKETHAELVENMLESARTSISGLVEGENAVASFEDIQYNDALSEFNITVNDQYAVWDMFNGFALYILGAYYQIFGGADPQTVDVVVNFVDEAGELKDTMSYREFMDNSAEEEAEAATETDE